MPADRSQAKTDPRVTRTRKLIEDAFLAVMEEKGFEGLSVQDVADRAGINRVTFYSHFVDTYALLRHAIRKAFEAEIAARGLADRALDVDSTRQLFLAVCSYVAGLHEHCKPPHDHLDWILGEVISGYCAELFQSWSAASGRAAPGRAAPGRAAPGRAATSRAAPGRAATSRAAVQSCAEAATAAGSSLYALAARWSRSKKRGPASAFVESSLPIVTGILGLR